jgi:hypothetical protein
MFCFVFYSPGIGLCFSQVASNWILQFYEALGAIQFCYAMPIYLSLGVGLAYSRFYLDVEIVHALRLLYYA